MCKELTAKLEAVGYVVCLPLLSPCPSVERVSEQGDTGQLPRSFAESPSLVWQGFCGVTQSHTQHNCIGMSHSAV